MKTQLIDLKLLVLTEPATAVTNLLLAGLALFIAYDLSKVQHGNISVRNWKLYFFFSGISNLVAIVVHGLKTYVFDLNHNLAWMVMNLFMGIGVYYAVQGATREIYRDGNVMLHRYS